MSEHGSYGVTQPGGGVCGNGCGPSGEFVAGVDARQRSFEHLEWFYLDRAGQEFGPFDGGTMKRWFDGGFFRLASDGLLVRLRGWPSHARVGELYGGKRELYFVATPVGPPPVVPPCEMHTAKGDRVASGGRAETSSRDVRLARKRSGSASSSSSRRRSRSRGASGGQSACSTARSPQQTVPVESQPPPSGGPDRYYQAHVNPGCGGDGWMSPLHGGGGYPHHPLFGYPLACGSVSAGGQYGPSCQHPPQTGAVAVTGPTGAIVPHQHHFTAHSMHAEYSGPPPPHHGWHGCPLAPASGTLGSAAPYGSPQQFQPPQHVQQPQQIQQHGPPQAQHGFGAQTAPPPSRSSAQAPHDAPPYGFPPPPYGAPSPHSAVSAHVAPTPPGHGVAPSPGPPPSVPPHGHGPSLASSPPPAYGPPPAHGLPGGYGHPPQYAPPHPCNPYGDGWALPMHSTHPSHPPPIQYHQSTHCGPPPEAPGAALPHGYGYGSNHAHLEDKRQRGLERMESRSGAHTYHGSKKEHMELNRKIIQFSDEVDRGRVHISGFIEQIDQWLERMNEVNLSTAFHRIAKLCRASGGNSVEVVRQNPRFANLQVRVRDALFRILERLGGSDGGQVPMGAACVCWAHATLRVPDTQLFAEVARRCTPHLKVFKNLEVANLLWSFAKLGEKGPAPLDLFNAVAEEAMSRPGDFTVVNLSTLVWSFATSRVKHKVFFRVVAGHLCQSAEKAESQEIANTLWAFATASVVERSLFNKLGVEAANKLDRFRAQEAANAAWAFGRVGVSNLQFFEALEKLLRDRIARLGGLSDYAPQHLAMVIGSASLLYPANSSTDGSTIADLGGVPEVDDKDGYADDDDADDTDPTLEADSEGRLGATVGPVSLRGQGLAVSLAAILLQECLRKVSSFRQDEAWRLRTACMRLGLRGRGCSADDQTLPDLAAARLLSSQFSSATENMS
eukprot:TRINITY_DN28222_c0_g1_i1.p1 TRINITY_DN28222_c0_g1~~TRINITY_DN28222_c0_g1_i1.p1  ORF type:complete len:953 (-),score=154.54 TRINITY_DN28222_c0_g1_i1:257-3115(-)